MAKDHPFPPSDLPLAYQPCFGNVLVTPVAAKQALEKIVRTGPKDKPTTVREVNWSRVDKYAHDMKEGMWRVAGDPICFNASGALIDGQHRLEAVLRSGVDVEMCVATNVPDDAFHGKDIGSARTAGQILGFQGLAQADQCAAVARWTAWYHASQRRGGRIPSSPGIIPGLSIADIEVILAKHPGIPASVQATAGLKGLHPPLIPWSAGGFVHYMGSRTSPELADKFFCQLIEHTEEARWSPVRVLRDWMLDHRLMTNNRVDRVASCWMTAQCWIRFEDGINGKSVRYGAGVVMPKFRYDIDAKTKAA